MFSRRLFWYLNMGMALGGWFFIIFGLFAALESTALYTAWLVVMLAWTLGHAVELTMAMPIGKKAGVSLEWSIMMTMIFGFTWWVPLKLNVFER